jgi:hypothetical protein
MIPYHPIRALPPAKDMNPRPRKGGETDGEDDMKETHHPPLDPTQRGNEAGVSYATWLPRAQRQRESKSIRTGKTGRGEKRRDGKSDEKREKKTEGRGGRRRGARGSAMTKDNVRSPPQNPRRLSLPK